MQTTRALLFGFALGIAFAAVPACGPAKAACKPSNCNGCCDASGTCQPGSTNNACGNLGSLCSVCVTGQFCNLGLCANVGSGGGGGGGGGNQGGGTGGGNVGGGGGNVGGGGGATGGGAGGGVGGGPTGGGGGACSGCTQGSTCIDPPNNGSNTTCGAGGNPCQNCTTFGQTCQGSSGVYFCVGGTGGGTGGGPGGGTGGGGATCDGCRLPSGTCVPLASTTVTNCGFGGVQCQACLSGQVCTSGVCTTTTGVGNIGDPCVSDNDCFNVALSTTEQQQGIVRMCKRVTVPGNVAYSGGYCTKRCLGSTACGTSSGTANVCAYYLGTLGEVENVCLRGCTATGTCRSGYECINLGSSTSPSPACWVYPNGALPSEYDAGPGNGGVAGGPCTSDLNCAPQPYAWCNPQTYDGGATGYTGGACGADCSLTTDDLWCGSNGICLPYAYGSSDGYGPRVFWVCGQSCTPGGTNTCRSGYVCEQFGTSGVGTCTPNCNNPGFNCGTAGCNTSTGLCN